MAAPKRLALRGSDRSAPLWSCPHADADSARWNAYTRPATPRRAGPPWESDWCIVEPRRRWDYRGLRKLSEAITAAVATDENLDDISESTPLGCKRTRAA